MGLAVTSHDTSVRNTARFDRVLVFGSGSAQNLLVNPGFEDSTIPALGPGWISDPQRQSAAQTETAQPLRVVHPCEPEIELSAQKLQAFTCRGIVVGQ